ncbi:MAG: hypothetical protein GX242_01045 [Clostridiales bacterium]|nr:hypothetical protein [Clostridiales bacterium]
MKKGMVLVIIQFVAVAAVLALTVVSYAWYTSHTVVNTENVTITAAESSEVYLEPEPDDYVPYKGETGLGYNDPANPDSILDIPYKAEKKFAATFKPVISPGLDPYVLSAYFMQINIAKTNGEKIDVGSDAEIMNSFTFRLHVYNDNYERIATFAPEGGDSILLVQTDGILTENGSYFFIEEEMTLKCGFEVIFLSESSYSNWLSGRYSMIEEFRYCDYAFMRAMFHITFTTGMSSLQKG